MAMWFVCPETPQSSNDIICLKQGNTEEFRQIPPVVCTHNLNLVVSDDLYQMFFNIPGIPLLIRAIQQFPVNNNSLDDDDNMLECFDPLIIDQDHMVLCDA